MFVRMKASGPGKFIIELMLIVLGISIALWLEGWAEHRQELETRQDYLRGLQDDLKADRENLDDLIVLNRARAAEFQAAIGQLPDLLQQPPDVQFAILFAPSTYHFFKPADFTFVAMQESGDFRLLSNMQLQRDLLHLFKTFGHIEDLQRNFIQALDAEYVPLMMRGIDIATQKITDDSLVDQQVFKNFFVFALQDSSQRLGSTESARQQVHELIVSIEAEIR